MKGSVEGLLLADSGGSELPPKAAYGKEGIATRFRCTGNLADRQLSVLLTDSTRAITDIVPCYIKSRLDWDASVA